MATIPLAIQPVQINDPLQQLQRASTIASMAQQRQVTGQEMQQRTGAIKAQDIQNQTQQIQLDILRRQMAANEETYQKMLARKAGARPPGELAPAPEPSPDATLAVADQPDIAAPMDPNAAVAASAEQAPAGPVAAGRPGPISNAPPVTTAPPVVPVAPQGGGIAAMAAPRMPAAASAVPLNTPGVPAPAPARSAVPVVPPAAPTGQMSAPKMPMIQSPDEWQTYWSDLIDSYANHGLFHLIPGIRETQLAQGAKVAEIAAKNIETQSKQIQNHRDLLSQATQGIQATLAIEDPQQRESYYKNIALPQLQALEKAAGNDPAVLPPTADVNQLKAMAVAGMKQDEYANHLKTANEMALANSKAVWDDAPKAHEFVQNLVGQASTPEQYTSARAAIQALADNLDKVAPGKANFARQELANLPTANQWTAQVQQDAKLNSMPAKDRPEYLQKQFTNAANVLAGAAMNGPSQYAAAYATLPNDWKGTVFPDPSTFNPRVTPDLVRKIGEGSTQALRSEIMQQQANTSEMRAKFAEMMQGMQASVMGLMGLTPMTPGGVSPTTPGASVTPPAPGPGAPPAPATPSAPSGATGASGKAAIEGEDYLKTLPAGFANQIRDIYEGRRDPPPMGSRSPAAMAINNALSQAYPDFDVRQNESRKQTLKEFNNTSPGKAGGNVLALNTMIHHADLYQKVAEALHNGNFTPGNQIYNEVTRVFGSAPPVQANLVARFLAGEVGKFATGGVATEGEINGIIKNLTDNAGPEQIAKAGETLMQIATGRMTPLNETVKENHLEKIVHVIKPDAAEILVRRGLDPETMKPFPYAKESYLPGDVGKTFLGADGKPFTVTAINPQNPKQVRTGPVGSPASQAPVVAPPATPPPAASSRGGSNPPKVQYTEQQVRDRGKASGLNPQQIEESVKQARAGGLIK